MQDCTQRNDAEKANHRRLSLPESPFATPQSSRDSSVMGRKGQMVERPWTGFERLGRYMKAELDQKWMAGVIVVCFFTSGLIDSVAFNSWSCFVGMQTGNSIFFALGLSGQPQATHRQQWYKSLVSIGSFCVGTLFFNFLHRYPRLSEWPTSRRRSIFFASFLIQLLLITIAAVLVTVGVVSNRPAVSGTFSSGSHRTPTASVNTTPNYTDLVPIALLAFEAAGQVCLSRVLAVTELPTIVLSTLYHDFTADLYGVAASWRGSTSIMDFVFVQQKRQGKRLASILALFLGGIVGGEMFKSQAGMAGALWMAVGIKVGVCGAWLMWREDGKSDGEGELPR